MQKKKRVLVIEDKDVVGALIRDILLATGRYEVVSANDGRKGILKVLGDDKYPLPKDTKDLEQAISSIARAGLDTVPSSVRFDLVVSDIRMPGMDGITTMKLIRRLYPKTPLIFITGYGIKNREADIEQVAPAAILEKPMTNIELISAIDELWTKSPGPADTANPKVS
jgi:CheY-like chemotaxis protein